MSRGRLSMTGSHWNLVARRHLSFAVGRKMSLSMASLVVGFGQVMNQSSLVLPSPKGQPAHSAGDTERQWWFLFPQKVSHTRLYFLMHSSEISKHFIRLIWIARI